MEELIFISVNDRYLHDIYVCQEQLDSMEYQIKITREIAKNALEETNIGWYDRYVAGATIGMIVLAWVMM
jgi:hypothetical protein